MALVGAALGGALFLLLVRLIPPRTSALVQLGRFDARRAVPHHGSRSGDGNGADPDGGPLARAARALSVELEARGVALTWLRQDLALTGRTLDAVLARQLLGLAAGPGRTFGVDLPGAAIAVPAAVTGAGFALVPLAEARMEAANRRRDFRRALGAYLDLVALEMAGSAAPAEALPNAARIGDGWPLTLLRHTLARATLAGRDPWQALTDLGELIGVTELRDLGGLVQLVGRDGARVRATLTARAATIRRRELADAEGQAGRRDQSMLVAQTLIGFGFVVFVAYPAVVNLMAVG
jgi:Flp pilus assembly protein TadB